MLTDARTPTGSHAHSGGIEAAVSAGMVEDLPGLEAFLRGRLATAGRFAAGIASASARLALSRLPDRVASPAGDDPMERGAWFRLDAETDARMPSPVQRAVSRDQGRAFLRSARAAWPAPLLGRVTAWWPAGPHHSIALGAVVAVAGGDALLAATAAAYGAVSMPAQAAVRLLGMDPIEVNTLLASLGPEIDRISADAVVTSTGDEPDWAHVAAPSAPALDLLAEVHARTEVRLFAS